MLRHRKTPTTTKRAPSTTAHLAGQQDGTDPHADDHATHGTS